MMSMKDERKPVSFIEDCAVPLEHLADYTASLNQVFEKHGTKGTFYAHASVGCLHVRPVLNLKQDKDLKAMRAIAEEAFALVEHTRARIRASTATASCARNSTSRCSARAWCARSAGEGPFDPDMLFNPGKIVGAPKFDDRSLLRFSPDYRPTNHALSTGPTIPAAAAVSRARSRCATTTAPAGSTKAARCARAIAPR